MTEDKLRDERKHGFYVVDNDIIDIYGPNMGVYGIAMYSLIARYANKNGENAFPSYKTITEKLNISRPQAVKTINLLVELGLITKEKRTDSAGDATSNMYALVDLGGGKQGLPPSKQHLPPSKQHLPQVVNVVNQGGKPGLPYKDIVKNTNITDNDNDTRLPMTSAPNQNENGRRGRPEATEQPTAENRTAPVQPFVKEKVLKTDAAPTSDAGFSRLLRILEAEKFGDPTPFFVKKVLALWNTYPHSDFDSAIEICAGNKKTLYYLEGVLKGKARDAANGRNMKGTPPPEKLKFKRFCLKTYHTDILPTQNVTLEKAKADYAIYEQQFNQSH